MVKYLLSQSKAAQSRVQDTGLKLDEGLSPESGSNWLCDLEQVISPRWASNSSSIEQVTKIGLLQGLNYLILGT